MDANLTRQKISDAQAKLSSIADQTTALTIALGEIVTQIGQLQEQAGAAFADLDDALGATTAVPSGE